MKKFFLKQSFTCFSKKRLAGLLATFALASGAQSAALDAELANAMDRAGLKQNAVALWVAPADSTEPVAFLNEQKSMQPASVIKVVTTLAALDLLKPGFVWKTDFTASAFPDRNGVVRGFGVRGSGDPHYVIERLWVTAQKLKSLGVKKIEGNITIDRSLFAVEDFDPGAFDGASWRTYNVGPDAAMINLTAVSLTFIPEPDGKYARIVALPQLSGIKLPSRIAMKKGSCSGWRDAIAPDFSDAKELKLKGRYPAACGERSIHLSYWAQDEYFTRVFKHIIAESGIVWNGKAVSGRIAKDAVVLLSESSEPLPLMVNWTNKFSNNPMARQIFLTLSFADEKGTSAPATLSRSQKVVNAWAQERAHVSPESLTMDNGSGLSRKTRVTAEAFGRILSYGYKSAVMPEFMASLPAAGEDGTMKSRSLKAGSAHIKTGFLSNVRSIAGYVTDLNGKRWSVVVMINQSKFDGRERGFSDAVMNWCATGGAQKALESQMRGARSFEGASLTPARGGF